MEVVEEDDVGETSQVLQTITVLGKDLNAASNANGATRLNRHAGRVCERRMDSADRVIDDRLHD
jgi:hypothetical protein